MSEYKIDADLVTDLRILEERSLKGPTEAVISMEGHIVRGVASLRARLAAAERALEGLVALRDAGYMVGPDDGPRADYALAKARAALERGGK